MRRNFLIIRALSFQGSLLVGAAGAKNPNAYKTELIKTVKGAL